MVKITSNLQFLLSCLSCAAGRNAQNDVVTDDVGNILSVPYMRTGRGIPCVLVQCWLHVTFDVSSSTGWVDCWSVPIVALCINYVYHPVPPLGPPPQADITTPEKEEILLSPMRIPRRRKSPGIHWSQVCIYVWPQYAVISSTCFRFMWPCIINVGEEGTNRWHK